jgi:putative photosynthetic complex assembly protein 2
MGTATLVGAVALTVLLWWGSTGLITRLVRRDTSTYPTLLAATSIVALLGLAVLVGVRDDTGAPAALAGFCAALALWSWIEVTFLTGAITGPMRALPVGMPRRGWRHALAALRAILWHELAIVALTAAVALLTAGRPNAIGLATLLVLWVLRSSAKLNLFLGVRNLGEGFLPAHLAHLLDYLHHRRMNALLPFSLLGGALLAAWLAACVATASSPADAVGYTMIASLATLGVLEHLLMVVPLPPEMLWGQRPLPPRATAGEPPP